MRSHGEKVSRSLHAGDVMIYEHGRSIISFATKHGVPLYFSGRDDKVCLRHVTTPEAAEELALFVAELSGLRYAGRRINTSSGRDFYCFDFAA